VALTLDDGPTADVTPGLLECLKRHGAKATMFCVGERAKLHPELITRIVREGHEVGNHGYQECPPAIKLTLQELEESVKSTQEALLTADCVWYRPASGWFNQSMIQCIKRHGFKLALGDVYPHDPHIYHVGLNATYILQKVEPGSIIILHDGYGRKRTIDILEKVLPELVRRGYCVVTLSELEEIERKERFPPI